MYTNTLWQAIDVTLLGIYLSRDKYMYNCHMYFCFNENKAKSTKWQSNYLRSKVPDFNFTIVLLIEFEDNQVMTKRNLTWILSFVCHYMWIDSNLFYTHRILKKY